MKAAVTETAGRGSAVTCKGDAFVLHYGDRAGGQGAIGHITERDRVASLDSCPRASRTRIATMPGIPLISVESHPPRAVRCEGAVCVAFAMGASRGFVGRVPRRFRTVIRLCCRQPDPVIALDACEHIRVRIGKSWWMAWLPSASWMPSRTGARGCARSSASFARTTERPARCWRASRTLRLACTRYGGSRCTAIAYESALLEARCIAEDCAS